MEGSNDPSFSTAVSDDQRDGPWFGDLELTVGTNHALEKGGTDLGDEGEDGIQYHGGNSGKWSAIANYVNTIVGAGIIGLPFAFSQCGLWSGIFLMILTAYLVDRSTIMLVVSGVRAKRLNYEELTAVVFGNTGLYIFCFFAFVGVFGAMSAYLVIIGDTIPEILLASGTTTGPLASRETVIFLFAFFLILPLASLKDLQKLSYASFFSVLADALIIAIVIVSGPKESSEQEGIDHSETFEFIRPSVFAGLGAISFAFVSQSSSFLVYRSLKNPGLAQWKTITNISVTTAWTMSMLLALAGYLSFVNLTEGDILNNFSTTHRSASAARGFLAVSMVFTYPMEMYVARHMLDSAIFQTFLGMGPITNARHYGISLGIWGTTVLLASLTDDLGILLEIFGAFSASVRYIFSKNNVFPDQWCNTHFTCHNNTHT
ncbi:unnamed protein product [Choristocarpus tenellus]